MSPQCPACGQEAVFIPQYQQWYCYRCRAYPFLRPSSSQQPTPGAASQMPGIRPPQAAREPVAVPDPKAAISKMRGSFMKRKATDDVISTNWVGAILIFQVLLPLSALLTVYLMAEHADLEDPSWEFIASVMLAVMLVSVGLAITHAILVFKLVRRRDRHFERDVELKEGMVEYLDIISSGKGIDLSVERWTMNWLHLSANNHQRSAVLWAVFAGMPLIGLLFMFFSQVFLTKDIQEHDEKQRAFSNQFMLGLRKAGIEVTPHDWQPLPRREVAAYAILTVLTAGLFFPYWWYVNIADMNAHMRNQWAFEDMLVENILTEG